MAKPKDLTERQKVLLDFVPKKFKGEQSIKIIYGALIYFSRCQEDHGLKVFNASNTALQEITSYGHSKISLALRWLENEKKIVRVERGTHFSGKSSAFTIIDKDYIPMMNNSGRMEETDSGCMSDNSGRMHIEDSGRMDIVDVSGRMDKLSNNQYVTNSGRMTKNSGRMDIVDVSGRMAENPKIVDANYNYNLNINYKDQQQTRVR